jgi:magnesium-transporting ATPase (P-type)
VTNSLGALARQMIYCTEPFRIEYAGRLNVVCFDKTGTLTKDEMVLKGVVGGQDVEMLSGVLVPEDDRDTLAAEMISPETTTDLVQCIMGSCHDLIQRNASFVAENVAKNVIGKRNCCIAEL